MLPFGYAGGLFEDWLDGVGMQAHALWNLRGVLDYECGDIVHPHRRICHQYQNQRRTVHGTHYSVIMDNTKQLPERLEVRESTFRSRPPYAKGGRPPKAPSPLAWSDE
jgi:hypothetical protein